MLQQASLWQACTRGGQLSQPTEAQEGGNLPGHLRPSPATGINERSADVLCTWPVFFRPSTRPAGALEMLPLAPRELSRKLSAAFWMDWLPRFKTWEMDTKTLIREGTSLTNVLVGAG